MDPVITSDLYRHVGKTGLLAFWRCFLLVPGFRYTVVLRKGPRHRRYSPSWLFWKMLHRRYGWRYGYQVQFSTKIGKGLYLAHFGSMNVNGTIGDNCNLGPRITIGRGISTRRQGWPTIGNRVWIGAGAVVVGGISVGNNVLIAPNAFVNFDVPDNSVVLGNPGKIYPKEDPTREYLQNVWEEAEPSCRQEVPGELPGGFEDVRPAAAPPAAARSRG